MTAAEVTAPFAVRAGLVVPRIATTVCVTTGALVALAPSLLPRGVAVQAILTGILAALGWAISRAWHRGGQRSTATGGSVSRARFVVAAAGAVTLGAAVLAADRWQNGLRAAMGLSSVGMSHWVAVLAGGGVVAGVLVGAASGVAALVRRLGRRRLAAVLLVCAAIGTLRLGPSATPVAQALGASNAAADLSLPRPESPSMSGSAASLTPWETLGGHGRRFVTAPAAASTVRTYVGLDSAPDLDARVRLAVRELERAGGLTRSHVVVTVPTGSGWIDGNAVAGFERRFAGNVAEVAVQYSAAPSWVTFVFDRDSARRSARALYTAVADRVSRMPPDARPSVHLYGQSLGAVGAAATDAACGVLLAGPPAGRIPGPGVTVLANASDPVVHWSPGLILSPPRLDGTRPDAPTPRWLPVVSFLQASVDLLTSLDAAPGHGHRYGTDQGTALPDC